MLKTLYTILMLNESLFLYFVLGNTERRFFMNTELNKQKWIKMVNDTLTMGGKSKINHFYPFLFV